MKRLFCFCLACVLAGSLALTPTVPVHATEPSAESVAAAEKAAQQVNEIEQQKKQKESERQSTQAELNAITGEIYGLDNGKRAAEAEVSELTSLIAQTMASVDMIEESIDETEASIEETTLELAEAEKIEKEQYEAMKKRIRYLYEKGDNSYMEMLLNAVSLSDMLNKAEYVQNLYSYDQERLDEYTATRKQVQELKAALEEEKSELEAAHYELELEKAELSTQLDRQKAIAADYAVQLARAQQEAAAYKAQIKRQNTEIKALAAEQKRIIAEEEARKKAEEEARKKAEEEARKKAEEEKKANGEAAGDADGEEKKSETKTETKTETKPDPAGVVTPGAGAGSAAGAKTMPPLVGSGTGSDIATYACQFVGNRYVAGGNNLLTGVDCSGFTSQVYKQYGYTLPRSSTAQRTAGREVSYAEAKAGDIICYAGHVALYLGNGRIVHASTPATGIKYGYAAYKTIITVRRIVG